MFVILWLIYPKLYHYSHNITTFSRLYTSGDNLQTLYCCRQHITHCNRVSIFIKASVARWTHIDGRWNSAVSHLEMCMLKDTITDQSEFDFAEEAHKEIHKQAHLKETWRHHSLVICNMLESSKENQDYPKCTYQTHCDSDSEHHDPPYCFILFGFLLADEKMFTKTFCIIYCISNWELKLKCKKDSFSFGILNLRLFFLKMFTQSSGLLYVTWP